MIKLIFLALATKIAFASTEDTDADYDYYDEYQQGTFTPFLLTARRGGKNNKKPKQKTDPIKTFNQGDCTYNSGQANNQMREANFLPFGKNANDEFIHKELNKSGKNSKLTRLTNDFSIKFNFFSEFGTSIKFMGKECNAVEIDFNGMGLKFRPNSGSNAENMFVSPLRYTVITGKAFSKKGIKVMQAMTDLNPKQGAAYFRMISTLPRKDEVSPRREDLDELIEIRDSMITDKNFTPEIAFILTIDKIPSVATVLKKCNAFNTYQIIVVSDGKDRTYTIVKYGYMSWGGGSDLNSAGFGKGEFPFKRAISGNLPGSFEDRFSQSNVGKPRMYVFDSSESDIFDRPMSFEEEKEPEPEPVPEPMGPSMRGLSFQPSSNMGNPLGIDLSSMLGDTYSLQAFEDQHLDENDGFDDFDQFFENEQDDFFEQEKHWMEQVKELMGKVHNFNLKIFS